MTVTAILIHTAMGALFLIILLLLCAACGVSIVVVHFGLRRLRLVRRTGEEPVIARIDPPSAG